MMMPNVSMNKMAMNESVATTCCFAVALQNGNVEYWDMPHGGYLGSGWIYQWNLATDADDVQAAGWFRYPNDINGVTFAQMTAAPLFRNEVNGAVVWTVGAGFNTNPAAETMLSWLGRFGGSIGAACNHNDGTCRYYDNEQTREWVTNYHWDSTSAHGGITNWQQPHVQARYSS